VVALAQVRQDQAGRRPLDPGMFAGHPGVEGRVEGHFTPRVAAEPGDRRGDDPFRRVAAGADEAQSHA
jgi:hypothetical protein